MTSHSVSVIIPTLREEGSIAETIQSVIDAGADEIIVADGGSEDQTIAVARAAGVDQVVESSPGRGIQLAKGAEVASSEWLLFLHADNRLAVQCIDQIRQLDAEQIWGAFEQSIEATGWLYRWLETGNAARVRWRQMPFGDQAIFVRRRVYHQVGGFPAIPLMEDVEFSRRLRKVGRALLLPGPVLVDARRWQRRGVVRQTARNWTIQIAYRMGVSPDRLRAWYR
ncbi:TIGR04283 family arsenosugar biosynthesis glycosyltransferase [Stieleria varia]|uniref:PGL/p-HBAD biosynthesis glycosyltransferase n=1 Tax=Stieleria varia TaxID=2528005 RepID=A0A5C6AZX3_9BACT|nr:TIGR04283 family arsenosugar biosynthesis glycosyltransferase [Stieleria varia]TWU05513.1 PGL/p-HBAD biosynthesis glycosyltransferase [Stieleria varia]